jgi:hypothetical protein
MILTRHQVCQIILHIYSHFVCTTVLNKCMKSLWNYVHYLFGNTHEWSKIYLGFLSQYCLYRHWRKSHWNYFYIPENDWMEIMSIWCYTSLIWGYNPFFFEWFHALIQNCGTYKMTVNMKAKLRGCCCEIHFPKS